MQQTLRQQRYHDLKRSGRGLVRRYVAKMTGLSRAQTTRLVTMHLKGEEVKPKAYRRHGFRQRYTREDIELLAAVDAAHETLSGPAAQKIPYRVYHDFGEGKYERLARLFEGAPGRRLAPNRFGSQPHEIASSRNKSLRSDELQAYTKGIAARLAIADACRTAITGVL